jgi:acyl carrier protein
MSREELIAKLIEFAALAYGADAADLNEDTNLNDLGVGSQQRVAMSASIENDFDVMIPVASFGKYESVGAIVDFVMEEM